MAWALPGPLAIAGLYGFLSRVLSDSVWPALDWTVWIAAVASGMWAFYALLSRQSSLARVAALVVYGGAYAFAAMFALVASVCATTGDCL